MYIFCIHGDVMPALVHIENPKTTGQKDLSDHFPIIIHLYDLKIVSYNLQFMPAVMGGVEGKKTIAEIQQAVDNFTGYFQEKAADVCCVQELFNNDANRLMEESMLAKGYVATERVGSKPLFAHLNGGVRTFVKKELAQDLMCYEQIYQNKIDYFFGGDALVNKGVTQTCFSKGGVKYHIFNTHLQAYYPDRPHYAEVTLAQCGEIKKFIKTQQSSGIIAADDKVILCGDFNIPKPGLDDEPNFLYEKMTRLMGSNFTFLDYNCHSAP